MSSTSSDREPGPPVAGRLALLLWLCLPACTTWPAPAHPRPALPLPDAIAARYALPGPVEARTLAPLGGQDGRTYWRGALTCGDEGIDFRLILPPGDGAAPLVLCMPILAGGEDLMWIIADGLAARGYAAAWATRVTSALRPPQREAELEALLRRTVVHNRALLAWARRQPRIDAQRTAALGVSLGGIVGSVLVATEPELRGAALCLAGGDLPDLLLRSGEDRVLAWRRWRHTEDGLAGSELRRQLRACLRTDPIELGPFVATERILLLHATFDEVVPRPNQDALWESFGRPRRLLLPLGHYSAALALWPVLAAVDDFLRGRFAGGSAGGDRRGA
jgi:dienelactone hydrolase